MEETINQKRIKLKYTLQLYLDSFDEPKNETPEQEYARLTKDYEYLKKSMSRW